MGMVLEATGLEKAFGRVRAVHGVDLSVAAGERVALLGPNGAGKTTTLLMLLGAITPDAGTIQLAGHELPKGRSAAMHEVGFVAGYLPLPERLRVREALSVFAGLYGLPRKGGRRCGRGRASSASASATWPTACAWSCPRASARWSASSRRRSTSHRCSCSTSPPPASIRTSPTGSGPPCSTSPPTDGSALLVTSHNMLEVERMCERVVFLAGGKVVADDTPAKVAEKFGHGDLEGVFLHLAGTVVAEDEVDR